MRSAPHWSLLKLHNAGLNPDLRPLYGNHSAPNGPWPCRLNNAIMGRLTYNSLTPGFMQHFRGQDSILTNGYPPEVDRVHRQKFLRQVTFSSPISRSALLVVDWMRTIIKRKKKKCLSSAALRRFASRADEPESNATGCLCWADSLRVTQVFAWEAVVGAGFRQPVVYQAGTTRGYQAGAPAPWQLFP